ncbi:hypothetical protein G7046_g3888 [Stylonectria norvegica]|nr:hypothetical protein G7046_g3888 [Stylonectria norvegica]
MPVFNEYNYKPLSGRNTIRLLTLHPSTISTAPLVCEILEQQISAQCQNYVAISYAWGEREFSRTLEIRCDGDSSYLRITLNLETLLRGVRASCFPRRLWIDAICLNQKDEMEKAKQIPLMRNIYKMAAAVEIWLGPESHTTAKNLAFFWKLSRLPDVTRWKSQREMADRIVQLMSQCFPGQSTMAAFTAIYGFFEHTWFSVLTPLDYPGGMPCSPCYYSLRLPVHSFTGA